MAIHSLTPSLVCYLTTTIPVPVVVVTTIPAALLLLAYVRAGTSSVRDKWLPRPKPVQAGSRVGRRGGSLPWVCAVRDWPAQWQGPYRKVAASVSLSWSVLVVGR